MLGVLVVFILSWLVLWIVFREHITILGILPNFKRLREFSIGLLVMAVFCAINLLGQSYFKEVSYIRNPEYGFLESLNGIWWTLKAALFEELIFRGALLYILIKKFGIIRAVWLVPLFLESITGLAMICLVVVLFP